jgi:hypothetical protein
MHSQSADSNPLGFWLHGLPKFSALQAQAGICRGAPRQMPGDAWKGDGTAM